MSTKEGKFISLPGLDAIKKKRDRERAMDLLEEGHRIKSDLERKEARLDEIKDELLNLQSEYDLPGFRNGPWTFAATWTEGRNQLNKDKLIEAGVSPEQIQAGYKKGEGYWKKELKKLEED